jgi:hypothetical protein
MKNLSSRERDAVELRNARRRRELDEKNSLWSAIIGRMRRVETWIVTAVLAIVMYSVVLPALQWVAKVFDTVSKVNGG